MVCYRNICDSLNLNHAVKRLTKFPKNCKLSFNIYKSIPRINKSKEVFNVLIIERYATVKLDTESLLSQACLNIKAARLSAWGTGMDMKTEMEIE